MVRRGSPMSIAHPPDLRLREVRVPHTTYTVAPVPNGCRCTRKVCVEVVEGALRSHPPRCHEDGPAGSSLRRCEQMRWSVLASLLLVGMIACGSTDEPEPDP